MTHTPEWIALRQQILDKAVVRGRVILSSGREADYYVDLRRVTLDAEAAPLVGAVMRQVNSEFDYSAVGGLTLGADPVATAMMHSAAHDGQLLNAFVVRKSEKQHGLQRRIEIALASCLHRKYHFLVDGKTASGVFRAPSQR